MRLLVVFLKEGCCLTDCFGEAEPVGQLADEVYNGADGESHEQEAGEIKDDIWEPFRPPDIILSFGGFSEDVVDSVCDLFLGCGSNLVVGLHHAV